MIQKDEKTLIREAQLGSEKAINTLLAQNERLIYSVVNKYKNYPYFEVEDYYQVGSVGLTKAIKKFDLSKTVKFSTYGMHYIKKYISEWHKNNRMIHIPKDKFIILTSPKDDEERRMSFYLNGEPISADASNKDNDNGRSFSYKDTFKDEHDYYEESEREEVSKKILSIINQLPYELAEIVKASFGIGKKVKIKDLCEKLNMSKPTLYRKEKKAMEILKDNVELRELYSSYVS